MNKQTLIFIVIILLSATMDHPDSVKNIPTVIPELVFYYHNNKIFSKKGKEIPQQELSKESLKVKKISKDLVFLETPENYIYTANLKSNVLKRNEVILKKPVSYNQRLSREMMDIDTSGEFYLYKHDIVRLFEGKIIRMKTNLGPDVRFYSVARDGNTLYVGTAVHGLYVANISANEYLNFQSLNSGLPFIPYNDRLNFFEEIHTLHVTADGNLYAGIGINGGLFRKEAGKNTFEKIIWPENWEITDVNFITSGKNGEVWVSCTQGLLVLNPVGAEFTFVEYPWEKFIFKYEAYVIQSPLDPDLYGIFNRNPVKISMEKKSRMERAASKKLFYLSPYNMRRKYNEVESLLKSNNFDGLILDVKDDSGLVLYDSQVPFIREIAAIRRIVDLANIVKLVHESKKYISVRIVVYKDPILFEFEDYAILDRETRTPWIGNPKERWIDPYNPKLAERYYIPMIQELESMGVDEIQLDYIRFPAEGLLDQCEFRYKVDDKYFTEAIEDFLFQIREATNLPISLDIYGYQGLYRTPGAIGQEMEVFGRFADVISPMLYSSHFGDLYLTDARKEERVYRLIQHSIRRAVHIANSTYLIRPYLQAFPMKSALWGYGDNYFLDQIRASADEKSSGFSFWGSIEHMQAVELAIQSEKK